MTYEELLNIIEKLDIKNQRISHTVLGTKNELVVLPTLLEEDETILYLIPGMKEKKMWLVVCTDKRVLFIRKGLLGVKTEEHPIKQIQSITPKKGKLLDHIQIWNDSHSLEIEYCFPTDVERFISAVKVAKYRLKDSSNPQSNHGKYMMGLEQDYKKR